MFLVTNVNRPEIKFDYSCVLRRKDKKLHVDPGVDNKMRCQIFKYTHVIDDQETIPFKHPGNGTLGKEFPINFVFNTEEEIEISFQVNELWDVPETFKGSAPYGDLTIYLTPKALGDMVIPKVSVFIGNRPTKLEGIYKCFIVSHQKEI